MKKKNIILIVLLVVALITSVLSLVISVLSKTQTQPKKEAEIQYKVTIEDDSEPGATTSYYLYDNGSIIFSHKKYCSIPDCEPEVIESEPLNFKEENLIRISKDNKIPMSFIVGRLAKNKKIKYTSTLYNKFKDK